MEFEQITTELADHVLTITLNRPERLNAFTATMGEELGAAFTRPASCSTRRRPSRVRSPTTPRRCRWRWPAG